MMTASKWLLLRLRLLWLLVRFIGFNEAFPSFEFLSFLFWFRAYKIRLGQVFRSILLLFEVILNRSGCRQKAVFGDLSSVANCFFATSPLGRQTRWYFKSFLHSANEIFSYDTNSTEITTYRKAFRPVVIEFYWLQTARIITHRMS